MHVNLTTSATLYTSFSDQLTNGLYKLILRIKLDSSPGQDVSSSCAEHVLCSIVETLSTIRAGA
jgi:hypothetical protein